ncbi:hypothetical protein [Nostoc sp.]
MSRLESKMYKPIDRFALAVSLFEFSYQRANSTENQKNTNCDR